MLTQLEYDEFKEAHIEDMYGNPTQSYVEMEEEKAVFERLERNYKYYIKTLSGKTYSNLNENESYETLKESSYFIRKFPYHTKGNDVFIDLNRNFIDRGLTGYIAVPKDEEFHSLIVENMYDYEDSRIRYFLFWVLVQLY